MSIQKKLQAKEKKRQSLMAKLVQTKEMVRGSFCTIHVKCGKKYCSCNAGKLHPHQRMSLREGGKAFSRAVPKEEHKWIKKMTDNYREFRKIRKELSSINKEIKQLLNAFEDELVMKSKKGKAYLEVFND